VSLQGDDNGRPATVYSNGWKVSPHLLFHEVKLTDFLLLYPFAKKLVRGPTVDTRIRPDAEMTIGKKRFFVELDTGEETHRQVRAKWSRNYRHVRPGLQTDFLLVVTLKSDRIDELIRNAKQVSQLALFTSLAEVQADPFGKVWTAVDGQKARIAKPKNK